MVKAKKQRLSKASIKKLLMFKDIELSDISAIQSAHYIKDWNEIKLIMNKPNISDKSAEGIGRLANQYIDRLRHTTPAFIKSVKSITGIELTTDFDDNLDSLGNGLRTTTNISTILACGGSLTTTKFGYKANIQIPNQYHLRKFEHRFLSALKSASFIKSYGINKFRVLLLMKSNSGHRFLVSTKVLDITRSNYSYLQQLIFDMNGKIKSQTLYEFEELDDGLEIQDKIYEISEVIIRWYK